MNELVCSDCYKTYNSYHGHICVDNRWIPGAANRSIPFQDVAIWLEESSSKPNDKSYEQTSVSTELVQDDSQLSHDSQNGIIGRISRDSDIIGKSNEVPVMEEEISRMEHLYISEKASDSAVIPEENHQSQYNRRIQEQILTRDPPSNRPDDLAIKEAEPFQQSMPSYNNSVKTIDNSATYIGLLSNKVQLDSSNVRSMPDKSNTMAAEYVIGLNNTEESATKGTLNTEETRLTGGYSEDFHHAVAGPSGLNFKDSKQPASSKEFLSQQDLKQQHMLHYIGESPSCGICQKVFPENYDRILEHMRTHKEDKPYVCNFCTKAFELKNQLDTHMFTHTGERPFKCDFCDKAYKWKKHLNAHRHIHTSKYPYKCDVCGKFFSSMDYLKDHKKSHVNALTCKICQKVICHKRNLSRHMIRHKGKPFRCEVCGKSFLGKSDLDVHFLIHSGVRPHACEICERNYTRKDSLSKHKKSHES